MREGRTATPDEGLADIEGALLSPQDAFRIALPNFEGPLDLLLHLIREHKLDIFDIPIALVTEKYLLHLEKMQEINLDIAGEFLVMASTLAHIKSRLLLPRQEVVGEPIEQEEQGDPRADLVRRLLDYQKYKEAAEMLGKQDVLDRDVFTRKVPVEATPIPDEEVGLVEISIYKLIEALDRVLKSITPERQHEVVRDRISITDAIRELAERLRAEGEVSFFSVFEGARERSRIIATFLAILEMCKLKLIRVHQAEEGGDILLTVKGDALANLVTPEVDESEYK
ncbi:MAG: segregation and condensation protein A [Myxococcaceae bacterium]